MHGGFGQRQQIGHAAFAAMIGEDGPIAAAEFGFQARQIARGGGGGALRIQAIVANGYGVRHFVADGPIDGSPGLWPRCGAPHQHVRCGDLETRDAHDAQSGSPRGGLRELHDAARPRRAGGFRVAPAFQIRHRRDQRNGPAALVRRAAKDGSQPRARDSFGAGLRLRLSHDGERLRLDHAVCAGGQQIGRQVGPAHSDAEQLVLRGEVFDGADEQAAGTEDQQGQSNGDEIARCFILKQNVAKCFGVRMPSPECSSGRSARSSRADRSARSAPAPGSGISLEFPDAFANRWLISKGTTLSAVPCSMRCGAGIGSNSMGEAAA